MPILTPPGAAALPGSAEDERDFVSIAERVAADHGLNSMPPNGLRELARFEGERAPDGTMRAGRTIHVISNSYGLQFAVAEHPRGRCPSRQFRSIVDDLREEVIRTFPRRLVEEKAQ
jgi:hypothetical protein